MAAIQKKLGWKRPLPMPKPFVYFPALHATDLPTAADVTNWMPKVYDQDDLGSCTGNAGSGLAEFVMKKTGKRWFMPSRLAIYYWTRLADGNQREDTGASLAQTMHTLETRGVPHESLWWYNIKKFAVAPNQKVVADAAKHVMMNGLAVNQDLNDIKSCLAEGWPFMFGFTVYESFENIAKME